MVDRSSELSLEQIARELAELRTILSHLDREVREFREQTNREIESLRKSRCDTDERLVGLMGLPAQLAEVNAELRRIGERLTKIELRLAEHDGERRAREAVGLWLRWLVPGSAVSALLAAFAAWWYGRH